MFHNVLVAVDGSTHSARALREAIDLVERYNARLTIMTSVPDASGWLLTGGAYGGSINWEALREETEREYASLLEDAVAQVPESIPVTKLLTHGSAPDRILEQLESGGHDLVVLGSRGRGDVRSLILGSVSHQVLNTTRVAVLVLHDEG